MMRRHFAPACAGAAGVGIRICQPSLLNHVAGNVTRKAQPQARRNPAAVFAGSAFIV
jgi:hypothetical protein